MTHHQHRSPGAGLERLQRPVGGARRRSAPCKKRCSMGKSLTSVSRRPRLRTTFCLTRPFSRTDSTTRTYSWTAPEELGTLMERMKHDISIMIASVRVNEITGTNENNLGNVY